MPQLDHKGPEGKGSQTGRGLGNCRKRDEDDIQKLGVGQGSRRQSGGGKGKGLRLKSSKLFDNHKEDKDENCRSDEE